MHVVLVGGGPRSIIQANSEMVFQLLYKEHFDYLSDLGARYNISLSIVEKKATLGGGEAFSNGHTGTMNSSIEDDIVFPIPLPKSRADVEQLLDLLCYRARYSKKFGEDNLDRYHAELRKHNLCGAVMFKNSVGPMSSSLNGELEFNRAFLLRRSVGEEELETFEKIRSLAEEQLPFFTLDVSSSSLVERILVTDGSGTEVLVRGIKDKRISRIQADLVRLNTGTTMSWPIDDIDVKAHTFCQSMNSASLSSFLTKKHLLDQNGKLIQGAKIISGGLSLSGLDQINALSTIMDLFEEDEGTLLGYRVTERAKKKYQGALTLLSKTNGKACIPRHTTSPEWRQECKAMGNTKHMHALFLHEHGQEVFRIWYSILEAAVARATNKTAGQVVLGDFTCSTREFLARKFQETEFYLESRRLAGLAELNGDMKAKEYFLDQSTHTVSGAWRQAALSCISGYGLEENLEKAIDEMNNLAPLTWKERHSMMYHRAEVAAITDRRFCFDKSNKQLVDNFNKIMTQVIASPAEIHSMLHLLLEAGIATHVTASYSKIRKSDTGNKLVLCGEQYDAFVVSPTFSSSSDIARKSLRGQVQALDEKLPQHGKIGKFRRFSDMQGRVIEIEDHGLGGKGFIGKTSNGEESLYGAFAVDVNNRASAAERAASLTMRRMALAHLSAAGLDASSVMDEVYDDLLPTAEEYAKEVDRFEKYYMEAHEINAYLTCIREVAKEDVNLYCALYDEGLTRQGRGCIMMDMAQSRDVREVQAASSYYRMVRSIPKFKAASRDDYFGRFVDTTPSEDSAAYMQALRTATEHLQRNRSEGLA